MVNFHNENSTEI